jgi:hypothetical protein
MWFRLVSAAAVAVVGSISSSGVSGGASVVVSGMLAGCLLLGLCTLTHSAGWVLAYAVRRGSGGCPHDLAVRRAVGKLTFSSGQTGRCISLSNICSVALDLKFSFAILLSSFLKAFSLLSYPSDSLYGLTFNILKPSVISSDI